MKLKMARFGPSPSLGMVVGNGEDLTINTKMITKTSGIYLFKNTECPDDGDINISIH